MFLDEKTIEDGYFSNTLHEDELVNGLRQRLRVSGALTDRSLIIENIAAQQDKRAKIYGKPPKSRVNIIVWSKRNRIWDHL